MRATHVHMSLEGSAHFAARDIEGDGERMARGDMWYHERLDGAAAHVAASTNRAGKDVAP